jgi:transposase
MVRAVVDCGLSKAEVARRYNITPKTVAKWVERFRDEGIEGRRTALRDLSSPDQTPPATRAAVEALRRQRHTGEQIARQFAISPATVSRILRRLGLNRLSALEPAAGATLRARASRRLDPHRHQKVRQSSTRSAIGSSATAQAGATAGVSAGCNRTAAQVGAQP